MGGHHETNTAHGLLCEIHSCGCGGVHLHVGPVSLHLSPENLLVLDDAVHRFARRVRGPRRAAPVRLASSGEPDVH